MLFITNRTPKESIKSKAGRKISFSLDNNSASQNLFFCERTGENSYREVTSIPFFQQLKNLPDKTQLLFYVHGFNNTPEADIFPRAEKLERLINETAGEQLVKVVPIIWPCDDDSIVKIIDDYWDDQAAADASCAAFARLMGKFDHWRCLSENVEKPCYRRMNILCHSMGNRVFRGTLKLWAENNNKTIDQLFRNVFMVAADVVNHTLEPNYDGEYIPASARNVAIYYANDDFAMPASKVANLINGTVSRRMGMTGPENLENLPRNIYEIDCDDFNNDFDKPTGHAYFLDDKDGNISPLIKHFTDAIKTGRITPNQKSFILKNK